VTRSNELEKRFYRIGEVAEIVGVKPHVLRYWESELGVLRPQKTRGAHRHYAVKDVETAMLVKRLLHDEGYTVPGAKKRLKELGYHLVSSPAEPGARRELGLRAELLAVRKLLTDFRSQLDHVEAKIRASEPTITVERVVPVTISLRPSR
jgi:DNA-binding transcriptional MerR regulator